MSLAEYGCVGDGVISTHSGRMFNVLDPQPENLDIQVIAHALSQINRFGGHTTYPYSVAQHSVHCASIAEDRHGGILSALLLLHDAAEAYCGDFVRPMKKIVKPLYGPVESALQSAVWQKWVGRDPTHEEQGIIHQIDAEMVVAEGIAIVPGSHTWTKGTIKPAPVNIRRWAPELAKEQFLLWCKQLGIR